MQYPKHILPALALATLAAAASAQTVPVKRTSSNDLFSVGVGYARSNRAVEGVDIDGYTVDLRASVASNFFLTASYTDLQADVNAAPDMSSYSVGFGTKFAAGNGNIEVSYAFRNVDITLADTDQHLIKVGYTLDLGNGFNVGLAVLEIINTDDPLDNVTAPVVSVGYGFGKGFSAEVSYSTEGTLMGLDYPGSDIGGTTAISLRYGF